MDLIWRIASRSFRERKRVTTVGFSTSSVAREKLTRELLRIPIGPGLFDWFCGSVADRIGSYPNGTDRIGSYGMGSDGIGSERSCDPTKKYKSLYEWTAVVGRLSDRFWLWYVAVEKSLPTSAALLTLCLEAWKFISLMRHPSAQNLWRSVLYPQRTVGSIGHFRLKSRKSLREGLHNSNSTILIMYTTLFLEWLLC